MLELLVFQSIRQLLSFYVNIIFIIVKVRQSNVFCFFDVVTSMSVGYVWCAGEAALMARARETLRLRGVPTAAMRVAAYWKRGLTDFHETLA